MFTMTVAFCVAAQVNAAPINKYQPMNFLRTIILSVTAALYSLSTIVAAEKVSGFASLPADDALEVTYSSVGCFHSQSHELTFTRSTNVTVSVIEIKPIMAADKMSIIGTNRVRMGDLVLSKEEVEGLDRLFAFYRSGPRSGCTTVDTISISQHRKGRLIAKEQFTDGSCSRLESMTRIIDLVAGVK